MKNKKLPPNTTIEEAAESLRALLTNPSTPAALYDALAEFVNEGIMIKNANGESLLDRWRHSPETILAACRWSREFDDLQSMAAENAATLRANGGSHAKLSGPTKARQSVAVPASAGEQTG